MISNEKFTTKKKNRNENYDLKIWTKQKQKTKINAIKKSIRNNNKNSTIDFYMI